MPPARRHPSVCARGSVFALEGLFGPADSSLAPQCCHDIKPYIKPFQLYTNPWHRGVAASAGEVPKCPSLRGPLSTTRPVLTALSNSPAAFRGRWTMRMLHSGAATLAIRAVRCRTWRPDAGIPHLADTVHSTHAHFAANRACTQLPVQGCCRPPALPGPEWKRRYGRIRRLQAPSSNYLHFCRVRLPPFGRYLCGSQRGTAASVHRVRVSRADVRGHSSPPWWYM
jgi:hypothetical protein